MHERACAARPSAVVQAPFGSIAIHVADGLLQRIDLHAVVMPDVDADDPLAAEACDALRRYLADARRLPRLPLAPAASGFASRVREALIDIPVGQTRTYGELAQLLRSAARAVGGACRSNPLPIVVPCHRVLAANGRGGFMGRTDGPELAIKSWLLRHEQEGATHAGRLL